MPTPKTIVEDQDGEMSGETNAVDNVINTNYRSEKSRKKKRGGGSRPVDELAPLGLPVLDKPSAGEQTTVYMQSANSLNLLQA